MLLLEQMSGAVIIDTGRFDQLSLKEEEQGMIKDSFSKNFLTTPKYSAEAPKCYIAICEERVIIVKDAEYLRERTDANEEAQENPEKTARPEQNDNLDNQSKSNVDASESKEAQEDEDDSEEKFEFEEESDEESNSDDEIYLRSSLRIESDDDIIFETGEDSLLPEEDELISDRPEWFSFEDKDQLKCIFDSYAGALKITTDQQRCVREPPKFVGRVKRSQVYTDTPNFQTLDVVDTYRRSILPPGSCMPHVKTVYLLTTWSYDEGVPINIVTLSNSQRKFWEERTVPNTVPSYLLCEPVFSTTYEYDFFVTDRSTEVRHSPRSYSHHCFDEFIPSTIPPRVKLTMSPTASSFFEDS